MPLLPIPILLIGAITPFASGTTVSLQINPPETAVPVASDLVSFSIEQDRWTDWAGLDSRNEFFFNTLDNIAQIAGKPPQIRIGADSADKTNFNPEVTIPQVAFPEPDALTPYPEAESIVVGDAYYQAARFLPPDTQVTWTVNLGQQNLTAAFLEAQAIANAFALPEIKDAGIQLVLLEIGNEPDIYVRNEIRPANWSVSDYVAEWTTFANNVSRVVGVSDSSTVKFLGAGFTGFGPEQFTAENYVNTGVLNSPPGSFVSTISQHHYSPFILTNGTDPLAALPDIISKESVRSNLTQFAAGIEAVRSKGREFVLGETNTIPLHGAAGISDSAGAALWGLDYAFFGSTIGISRSFFTNGIGYKYNFIQPVTLFRDTHTGQDLPEPLPPHIQPLYYSAIIAAEAIGNSGSTQIVEVAVDETGVAGYAFYENGKLARALFIDSEVFLSTSSDSPRSSVHLDLDFDSEGITSFTAKRLAIRHADDLSGLTWGGQTYETADGRVTGELVTENGSVADGLDVSATEVALLTFDY